MTTQTGLDKLTNALGPVVKSAVNSDFGIVNTRLTKADNDLASLKEATNEIVTLVADLTEKMMEIETVLARIESRMDAQQITFADSRNNSTPRREAKQLWPTTPSKLPQEQKIKVSGGDKLNESIILFRVEDNTK